MNKKVLFFNLFCLLFLLFLQTDMSFSQQQTTTQRQVNISKSSNIKSFWELTEKAGIFRWPLFMTFVIGIFIITGKVVSLIWDKKNTRPIYRMNFSNFQNIEQIAVFAKQHKCVASDLLLLLIKTFKSAPGAVKFHEELEKFRETQKQNFTTFQNRMSFWSDTAGALGLLGTVWGMFITFFRGTMEKQEILSGMGIALITTLMGLVISIILNFFTTEVSSLFNKILNQLFQISERLWLRILEIQPAYQKISSNQIDSTYQVSNVVSKTSAREKIESEKTKYELLEVSGNGQKAFINRPIKSPLVVELNQIKNGRKQKVPGEPVVFFTLDAAGKFEDGKHETVVKTSSSGKAGTYFIPSKSNSRCRVGVKHETLPVETLYFDINVKALEPADIIIKSGNNQSGPAGRTLPGPIVIEVMDKHNNPVSNCIVNFRTVMGNGSFHNKKSSIEIPTDGNGLAQVEFTLDEQAGFNSIEAAASGLSRKGITINALGQ